MFNFSLLKNWVFNGYKGHCLFKLLQRKVWIRWRDLMVDLEHHISRQSHLIVDQKLVEFSFLQQIKFLHIIKGIQFLGVSVLPGIECVYIRQSLLLLLLRRQLWLLGKIGLLSGVWNRLGTTRDVCHHFFNLFLSRVLHFLYLLSIQLPQVVF